MMTSYLPVSLFVQICRKAGKKEKEKRPLPLFTDEKRPYLDPKYLTSLNVDINLKEEVRLPDGLDLHEWLASYSAHFFEHINLLYGTISELCTAQKCACMTGPANTQYQWVDDKGKKVKCSAPQYIDLVMTCVQKMISDESTFPTKMSTEFSPSFITSLKRIFRLFFQVMAHMYHAHFQHFVTLKLHEHFNTLFIHFIYFARAHDLVDLRDTAVLDDLVDGLKLFEEAPAADQMETASPTDDNSS